MPSEGEGCINAHRGPAAFAIQFDKAIFQRLLDVLKGMDGPVLSQGLLGDVSDKIARIESRIAETIEIEIDQPQA